MSVTSGFFDSMNKDRLYNTRQLSSIFDGIIKDGVYMGYEDALMVKASEPASLTVNVGPGRSWFNHTWTYNDAPLPIEVDPGDVVLDRIDTIVNDVDTRSSVRKNAIILVKGTPSSQATAPVLINEEGHRQYPLCNISMPAGSTTVTQAQITNRIGTSDCPFVTGIIETISTDELLAQWNAEYREWYARVQAETEQWTEQQQTEFTEWMNARKEEFDAWFSGLQTILDGDVAGNLLNRINHRTGINATATYSEGVVAITAPDDAGEILTFVAPSDFLSTDTYTLNGEALTITDLNGEALDDSWKKNSPVTITVSGGKAFFKAGGSGKNDTLPPLLGNMTVEVVEGEETDTYTIKMDKLVLDKTTEMVGGAQLEWGEEMPAKPGKGTGGIKTWTRDEILTTGKPFDGLYLGDVTPSDGINKTIIWFPENKSGNKALKPFLILSSDYLGGVYIMRFGLDGDYISPISLKDYDGCDADRWCISTYLASVLDPSVADKVMEVDVPLGSGKTIKRKCWLPSTTELMSGSGDAGTFMPYFSDNSRRIAYLNETTQASVYWTRNGDSVSKFWSVTASGGFELDGIGSGKYLRPCFVLPKDFKIQQRPDGSYTVYDEHGLMTLSDIEESTDTKKVVVNVAEVVKATKETRAKPFVFAQKKYSDTDGGLLVMTDKLEINSNMYGAPIWTQSNSYQLLLQYSTAKDASSAGGINYYLSESVQNILIAATVKYRDGGGSLHNSKEKCFLLGSGEVSYSAEWANQTGSPIPYYSVQSNRVMLGDNGVVTESWLRDVYGTQSSTQQYLFIGQDGQIGVGNATISANKYLAPCIVLPLTTPVRALPDGSYDLVPEDPALKSSIQTFAPDIPTTPPEGTLLQLKDIEVATRYKEATLKIPETDGEQDYIYLVKGYEGSNGGAAIRKSIPAKGNYSSASSLFVNYGGSTIDTYFVDFAANNLSEEVKKYLVEAQIQARGGPYSRSCFTLSDDELGVPKVAPVYGTKISYFDADDVRKATYQDAASSYWCRDTSGTGTGSTAAIINDAGGVTVVYAANATNGFRPVILLSLDTWFVSNGDDTYTFVGEEEPVPPEETNYVTHTVEVPHGQKVVFRQFTQNQKKQFQTMLVGGVYPPLGNVEPAFKLPEFTGNHAIFGDEIAGRIEIYESGELRLNPGTYDFFLVGGGGPGFRGGYSEYSYSTGGGGGGGYTYTEKNVVFESLTIGNVLIGGQSSHTAITIGDKNMQANGGASGSQSYGGAGGSGGGGGGYERDYTHYVGAGGSDGAKGGDGYNKTHAGGAGQGSTTRSFGEPTGVLYGGGGGGGAVSGKGSGGAGGEGGGGAGGNGSNSTTAGVSGTPNTGGGGGGGADRAYQASANPGAGGSGIMIIRWNNAA